MDTYSPGMRQFLDIKRDYEDYILFFRMGDFYEFFFDDAIVVSRELEMTLTSRSGSKDEKIPMCGFPHKAGDIYVDILVNKGYKIAMCEQVEDPKLAKGVVKREVVQLITPGTIMQGKTLEAKYNNYIATINEINDNKFGLSYCDLSTGESFITLLLGSFKDVLSELSSLEIKEVVIDKELDVSNVELLVNVLGCIISYESDKEIPKELESTVDEIKDNDLLNTFGRLLNYLVKTQKRSLGHLQKVEYYEINKFMNIDIHSKRNLELFETNRSQDKNGSLLRVLDDTVTAMGGRRLKQWLERPLLSKFEIENRQSMVETLMDNYFERNEIKEILRDVYDLERLSGRVSFGNVNAKDLIQLKKSLKNIPNLIDIVFNLENKNLKRKFTDIDTCEDLYELLEISVNDEPPMSIKEGNIIKDYYNEKLDLYRSTINNDKDWVASFEKREREETGIKLLKVNYNRAAGYYIEIPKNHIHLLEEGKYIRKQTLTNVERYVTEELKEKESLILEAEDKIVGLEYDLFLELREKISEFIPKLQELSKSISELDVLQSFAEVSEKNYYTMPILSDNDKLIIQGGRHPVIEKVLSNKSYIKNDCEMDKERELLLITGPNMSGKSTYMRQVALTSIMVQIGCYVSADYVEVPIFDQIFTRIGAADDLVSGQSTFMVEMMETQNALSKATSNSLILLDEIGRGTSTYDGVAIAQAIIEYVHDNIGAKTFFSTHYHELTKLENNLNRLKNIRVSVIEENEKVVFLHKVEDGAADRSYGIYVAELAELPSKLITRAKEILIELESENIPNTVIIKEKAVVEENKINDNEKEVLSIIKEINMLNLSPMDTFKLLNSLNDKLNK